MAEELSLDDVVRLPSEAVRVLRLAPAGTAGLDEQLGNAVRVEVTLHRQLRRGSERSDVGEDVVHLDELFGQRHRSGRVVLVVVDDVLDLAPVDAAVGVDVLEDGIGGRGDLAVARRRGPRQRRGRAEHDLVRGHPRHRRRLHRGAFTAALLGLAKAAASTSEPSTEPNSTARPRVRMAWVIGWSLLLMCWMWWMLWMWLVNGES